jgi:hypothetical protein
MRATTNDKRKGPDHAVTRNLALKSELPRPKRQGKTSSGYADLQQNRKTAAKEFVDYYHKYDGMFPERRIYYTPAPAVMWRLDHEWIPLTPENVAEAWKEIAEEEDLPLESCAKVALHILKEAKRWTKIAGRVGWVLPKLETEVVSQ